MSACLLVLAILLPAAESHPRHRDSPTVGCTPGPTTDQPEVVADGSADGVSLTLQEDRWARIVVDARTSTPAATVLLWRYEVADDSSVVVAQQTIPALAEGEQMVCTLPIGAAWAGDIGLSASVDPGGESLGTMFLAVRSTDGRTVTAPSLSALDDAELTADLDAGRISEEEYNRRISELHRAPGSEDSIVTP
jgi:hypothetical protein